MIVSVGIVSVVIEFMPNAIQLVLLLIFYLWLCCWYWSIVAQVLLLSLFFLCVLFVFCWCWNNLFFAGRTQCTISRATTTTTTTTQVSLSLEELVHLRGPAIIQGARAPMIIPIIHPGWPTLFANGGNRKAWSTILGIWYFLSEYENSPEVKCHHGRTAQGGEADKILHIGQNLHGRCEGSIFLYICCFCIIIFYLTL